MTPLSLLALSRCLPLLEAKSRTCGEVSPHNCLGKAAIWLSYSCLSRVAGGRKMRGKKVRPNPYD